MALLQDNYDRWFTLVSAERTTAYRRCHPLDAAAESAGELTICEYCNGNEETQQPLEDNGIGVFTIIAKEKQLSCVFVSTRPMEALAKINFCPMCGRNLKEHK